MNVPVLIEKHAWIASVFIIFIVSNQNIINIHVIVVLVDRAFIYFYGASKS